MIQKITIESRICDKNFRSMRPIDPSIWRIDVLVAEGSSTAPEEEFRRSGKERANKEHHAAKRDRR